MNSHSITGYVTCLVCGRVTEKKTHNVRYCSERCKDVKEYDRRVSGEIQNAETEQQSDHTDW